MPEPSSNLGSLGIVGKDIFNQLASDFPSAGDFLLQLVSHFGRMKNSDAEHAFLAFCSKAGHERKSFGALRRMLFELGHIDFENSKQGLRLVARPPGLVLTMSHPTGEAYEAVLCGARSKSLVEMLKRKAGDALVSTSAGDAPKRHALKGGLDLLVQIADSCNIARVDKNPVAWHWLHFSASLDDWWTGADEGKASTQNQPGPGCFNPASLAWDATATLDWRLIREKLWGALTTHKLFYKDGGGWSVISEVDPDWAKWLVIRNAGRKDLLYYNEGEKTVEIPQYCPLPGLLGRAICMCSCKAPGSIKINGMDCLEYGQVPPVVAKILEDKLGYKVKRS